MINTFKVVNSNSNNEKVMKLGQQYNVKTLELDLSKKYLIPTNCIKYVPRESSAIVKLQDTNYDFGEVYEKNSIQKEIYFIHQNNSDFLRAMIASRHKVSDKNIILGKSGNYKISDSKSNTIKQIFVNNNNQFICSVFDDSSITQKIIEFAHNYHIPLTLIEFPLNNHHDKKIPINILDYKIFVNCNQYKNLFEFGFNSIARISDLKKRIIKKMNIQKVKKKIMFLYKNVQINDDEILSKFANDEIDMRIEIELTFSFYSDKFFKYKNFFPIDSKFIHIKNYISRDISFKHHQYIKNTKTLNFYKEDTNDLIHPNDTIKTIGFHSKIIIIKRNEKFFKESLKITLIKFFYFLFFDLWIYLYNSVSNNWEIDFEPEEKMKMEHFDEVKTDFTNQTQIQIETRAFTKWINSKLKIKNKKIEKFIDLTNKNNFSLLIEAIWGAEVKNNQKSIINYLQNNHNISIHDPNLEIVNDLYEIVWEIIYKNSIEWINFEEEKGEKGLLKWVCNIIDKPVSNFYEDWKDGTILCLILNHFFPNEINQLNIKDAFAFLSQKEIPLYFDYEDFLQNNDEKIILLQCSELFDYFTSKCIYDANTLLNNESQEHEPDFDSGRIDEIEIQEIRKEDIINHLNNHFTKVMPPRHPVLVARIENGKAKFFHKSFINVIKRAGSRPIIFCAGCGRFQQGKTFIISGLTGNWGHKIGNGFGEQTKGVYIDGPYSIDYFYERFNISGRESIYYQNNKLLTPLVFFFDIEGYGFYNDGNSYEEYIKMSMPFLCLSSVFLFLSDKNPGVNEIQKYIEQIKISNLTTHSNDSNSNGSLKLLVVLNNYYPKIANMDDDIKKLQSDCNKEWNGSILLSKYGIKYEFQPIYAYNPCYEKKMFCDSFQRFATVLIRSIENATEGNFIRCGNHSIKLFNYIIQHNNQPLFDQRIKKIIKDYHENSFETIAYNALQQSHKVISIKIKNITNDLYKDLSKSCNFAEFSDNIVKISENEINKYLFSVKDKRFVLEIIAYFKQSMRNISEIIFKKYSDFKNNEVNKCYETADSQANVYINEIMCSFQEEMNKNKLSNFSPSQFVDISIKNINIKLNQYKNEKNLVLLTNQMLEDISESKRDLINNGIKELIIKKDNEIKYCRITTQVKASIHSKIKNIYNKLLQLLISNKINELHENLLQREYYLNNYRQINNLTNEYINWFIDELKSQKDEIVIKACNSVKKK